MDLFADIIGWVFLAISWTCLLAGSFFAVVGGIGVLRFPDLFSRMHGSGITDTLGAGLLMVGLMFQSFRDGITTLAHEGFDADPWLAAAKLLMILFFLLITSPTSGYALAQAALTHGVKPMLAEQEDPPSKD